MGAAMGKVSALALILLLVPSTAASGQTDVPMGDVEQVLQDRLDSSGIPGGAVVVVDAGGRIEARALGSAGGDRDVTTSTPFVIGSTTKSFTALAVMQLVDSGDVAMGESVLEYVPELQLADRDAADRITIRRLLQHTSGLSDAAAGAVVASAAAGTPLDAVAEMRGAELLDTPGDAWHYANINYVLAGLVVERASGMPYADYVQDRILDPLGMTRSFVSDEAAESAGLSRGHRFWFGLPAASGPMHRDGLLAAGYLISTVEDLGRYLSMYLDNGVAEDGTRIVSEAALADMLSGGPQARLGPWADGARAQYAMGWMVGGPWADGGLFHPGNSPDSSAMIALFPDRGLAMATVLNAGHELPVPGNPAATDRISRDVGHAVLGEPVPESSTLRTFYLVFDVIVLVLAAAATVGLVRSVQTLRRRRRPSHAGLAWVGVLVRAAVAGVLLWALLGLYGWRETWTWAPDLGLVVLVLSVLLAATAAVRLTGLVVLRR